MTATRYHHGDLKNALIQAGIDILSHEGVNALSLRRVAQRAGVSHAAPYAHFADKQELIAAISTAGFEKLYHRLAAVRAEFAHDPLRQLIESAWAYVSFALDDPDHFKVTFSGVLEKEKDYPAFVTVSHDTFQLVVLVVEACQKAEILKPAPADLLAVTLWAAMHGLAALVLEGQIMPPVMARAGVRQMLIFALNQFSQVAISDQ